MAQNPVMLTPHAVAEIELVDPARLGLLETVGLVDVAMRQATVCPAGSVSGSASPVPSPCSPQRSSSMNSLGLDLSTTLAVEEVVRRVAKEGAVVVLATHDLAQARRLADRRLLLAAGRSVHGTVRRRHDARRSSGLTWRKHRFTRNRVRLDERAGFIDQKRTKRLGLLGMRTIERNDAVRIEHDLVVVALELQVHRICTEQGRAQVAEGDAPLFIGHRDGGAHALSNGKEPVASGWTPESSSITSPRPSSDQACHKACSFMCVPEASPWETKHRSSSTTASKTSNSVPFMGSGVRSTKVFHAKTVRDVPCPCSRKAASASGAWTMSTSASPLRPRFSAALFQPRPRRRRAQWRS